MPLLQTIRTDRAWGGIWKITESWEQLCAMLPRAAYHREYAMRQYVREKRRVEYAAVRALLYGLTGEDREVAHYLSGRPYFPDTSLRLSVSHTAGYAVVLLSESAVPGVDIEVVRELALRVRDRIVGPSERAENLTEVLLHWSAKETVFKILDRPGIDFIRHFSVRDLCHRSDDTDGAGQSCGTFRLDCSPEDGLAERFSVHYIAAPDFVLTYACGDTGAL